MRNLVGNDAACGGVDEVQHVVNATAEGLDIFAIERRDERLVQASEQSVSEVVTGVFDILDALGIFFGAIVFLKHFHEYLSALMAIIGQGDKHLKEIIFA